MGDENEHYMAAEPEFHYQLIIAKDAVADH